MSNPQAGIFVQFYTDAVEQKFESEKQGRPVFKDVPHIRKTVPGDASVLIERPSKQYDYDMFPREWDAYKRQNVTGVTGTPLEAWPQITRSQVKESRYFEIHTVEQMSELSDQVCMKLGMGFSELREKAKAYLQAASGVTDKTEKDQLRAEMEELKAQIAAMSEAPKRGRPVREVAEV